MPNCMVFVSPKIEGFSCNKEVKRVVVEGGYICRFPNLILKAISELILDDIAMCPFKKGQNLILFALSYNTKIKFIYLILNYLRYKAIPCFNIQIFP